MILLLPGCSDQGGREGPSPGSFMRRGGEREDLRNVLPVRVENPAREDVYDYILSNSAIEPSREVEVVSRTSGEVLEIHADVGSRVERGELVLLLDDAEIILNLKEAEINLKKAKRDYDRASRMFKDNLISKEEYEGIQLALDTARNQVNQMNLQLEYTKVKSPISGVVTERGVDQGDHVSSGVVLFRIVDTETLFARVHVPEVEYGRLAKDQEVMLELEALGDVGFEGRVERINPIVDPQSGTIEVRVEVSDPDRRLLPGMFATVKIVTEKRVGALTVPKQSLLLESGGSELFIVDEGRAKLVRVEKGIEGGERVEIVSGLAPGAEVVVAGQESLREGVEVRIVGEGKSASADLRGEGEGKGGMEGEGSREAGRFRPGKGSFFMIPREMLDDARFVESERFEKYFNKAVDSPRLKGEYEKRLKEEPALATNPAKKAEFLKEHLYPE